MSATSLDPTEVTVGLANVVIFSYRSTVVRQHLSGPKLTFFRSDILVDR